jgi:hypothetical protein
MMMESLAQAVPHKCRCLMMINCCKMQLRVSLLLLFQRPVLVIDQSLFHLIKQLARPDNLLLLRPDRLLLFPGHQYLRWQLCTPALDWILFLYVFELSAVLIIRQIVTGIVKV